MCRKNISPCSAKAMLSYCITKIPGIHHESHYKFETGVSKRMLRRLREP